MLPKKLQDKLDIRKQDNAFRKLGEPNKLIDFSSNDYLGFATSKTIFEQAHHYLLDHEIFENGTTGSRLLSGNHNLFQELEQQISKFHNSETALVFNSGYDANLGFFSSVPQRNDIILYDEYCHASIRDGITMSKAKNFKFQHNDLVHLEELIKQVKDDNDLYIVTESVFSMDGDSPHLVNLSQISKTYAANLIVDEAHAVGVFGNHGNGLINEQQLEDAMFARIITFGKALGVHGATILCNHDLRDYLINFSRPFIYTTALPPHTLATLKLVYTQLATPSLNDNTVIKKLQQNIAFFKTEIQRLKLQQLFIESDSAIHSCIISGNEPVKHLSNLLQNNGFDIKAILSPTVPKGEERLRICLHSYNSSEEITQVLELLATFV